MNYKILTVSNLTTLLLLKHNYFLNANIHYVHKFLFGNKIKQIYDVLTRKSAATMLISWRLHSNSTQIWYTSLQVASCISISFRDKV